MTASADRATQRWWERATPDIRLPSRREILNALLSYYATAGVAVLTLLAIARANDKIWGVLPLRGDAGWYVGLAEHGYVNEVPHNSDGSVAQSNLAFFPAVPALMRVVHTVTGLDYKYAGVLVSLIAAGFAAVGIFTLVRGVTGADRAGYIATALWACVPASAVEWIGYTESLATALLVWTMISLLRGQWLLAGALAFCSGLVRSSTTALVLVVGGAALVAIIARRGRLRDGGWKPWVAAGIAPLGILTAWGIIGLNAGRWDGWFEAEKAEGWNQRFDGGARTIEITKILAKFGELQLIYLVAAVTVILAAVAIVALAFDRRVPWTVVGLVILTWIVVFGTAAGYTSKARYLLPIMPLLLIPLASSLGRARLPVTIALCAACAVLAGWYGAFLFTHTHEAI